MKKESAERKRVCWIIHNWGRDEEEAGGGLREGDAVAEVLPSFGEVDIPPPWDLGAWGDQVVVHPSCRQSLKNNICFAQEPRGVGS